MVPEVKISSSCRTMPVIAMGTSSWPPVDLETAKAAILQAIKTGYRHFDTAFSYGSEKPLGEAIAEALRSGLIKSREELFITTKLWASAAERDLVVPAIKMSLQNLQLDYIDLYLIHWPLKVSPEMRGIPVQNKEHLSPLDIKSVWEGMEECQRLGLAKAIGVSNFSCKKLDQLLSFAKISPAVNQVEMNPLWRQKQLREYCVGKKIHITAYTPLGANGTKWGDNRIVENDVLADIAKAKGKTTAQVALRWLYEQGVSIVAKSFNRERMKQNLEIFDWSLTQDESNMINHMQPQRKCVTFASILGPHDLALELDAEI